MLWVALPRLRPATDDVVAVREVEARLSRASALGDTQALSQIVAKDFFAVSRSGKPENRQALLDLYRTSTWKVVSFRQGSIQVHLYGETAIVTGVDRVRTRDRAGHERLDSYRFLHVFEKKDGRWQLISGQLAPLAAP